jgi:hypothetical protein
VLVSIQVEKNFPLLDHGLANRSRFEIGGSVWLRCRRAGGD